VSTRDIVVENVLPHAPEVIWKTLTTSELIARWLMPNDFQPVIGHRFTFKTRPIGDWDGVVQCQVLEAEPGRRLVYSWTGGGGSMPEPLDSVVTWTLEPAAGGTRVRMVHSGFKSPQNDPAYEAMSPGWGHILEGVGRIAGELSQASPA
jgi:uncharacterized protein YndB with AHSA1/START domain